MLGFKFAHFDSMMHVIVYKNGQVKRQGRGLSFFYYAPTTSIVTIPVGSNSLPFIFSEITGDYQKITIQGQVTYRVEKPTQLADMLDFTVNTQGHWKKNDTEKLNQTIINESQTAASAFVHELGLKEAIRAAKQVEETIFAGLKASLTLEMLGVGILSVNILAVQPTPEMARALETETREKLQQDADHAVFERRNFAVEQERIIKESELNTEIAVEEKKKQIAEKQTETKVQQAESERTLREMKLKADISIANQQAENERTLREMKIQADISVEKQRQELIGKKAENDRIDADTKGYLLEKTLKPYQELDWKTLIALGGNNDPRTHLSLAFRLLAENAEKIGNLNITPDLLETLIQDKKEGKR